MGATFSLKSSHHPAIGGTGAITIPATHFAVAIHKLSLSGGVFWEHKS